jgi:hypothetical protein
MQIGTAKAVSEILLLIKKEKVKASRNRSGVAERVPGGLGSQICITFGT